MSARPDVGLERLIHGLEEELLGAPDEEFMSGAHDLGMNPEMKGSAAFVGIKYYLGPLAAADCPDQVAAKPEKSATSKYNPDT